MLLIDSRVWLLGIICCLLGGGIRAEEFTSEQVREDTDQ